MTDDLRDFIGPRDSERFPRFTSFDLQVTRPIRVPLPHEKFKARIGFSVFNLFNHFNPRDVQNDVDSDRFGALLNAWTEHSGENSFWSSKAMRLVSFLLFSTIAVAADTSNAQLPTGDQVVARMLARDNERQATLNGYTAARRYVLENQRYGKHAEMLVRMTCQKDGSKQFETVSATGWGGAEARLPKAARGRNRGVSARFSRAVAHNPRKLRI